MKRFAHERNIKELDRKLVLQLIDKIIVHEGKKMEIIFRYKDEFKAVHRIAGMLPQMAGGEL